MLFLGLLISKINDLTREAFMGLLSMILINSFAVIEPCMQIMTTYDILSDLLENCEIKTLTKQCVCSLQHLPRL